MLYELEESIKDSPKHSLVRLKKCPYEPDCVSEKCPFSHKDAPVPSPFSSSERSSSSLTSSRSLKSQVQSERSSSLFEAPGGKVPNEEILDWPSSFIDISANLKQDIASFERGSSSTITSIADTSEEISNDELLDWAQEHEIFLYRLLFARPQLGDAIRSRLRVRS